jgi:hypothetical protein
VVDEVRRRPGWSCAACLLGALTIFGARADAYSVLAHESNVDAVWDDAIRPLLLKRFPRATAQEIAEARAFAYGGSVIQDLGYYPFGSHFFSNLVHYVRSGDFVEALVRDARTLDELAFALGALGHYAADNTGHPEAVNRAVALMFPKLRAKYGESVTYVESPATHVLVEFSFDVVQAAAGTYAPESYHDRIGFEVAKPLLQRAFFDTYRLELKDVFLFDDDLAIGSYRHAISDTIPEMTRVAWRDKQEEILKLMPGITRERFIYQTSRKQYVADFGDNFKEPGFFARIIGFLYRLLPKIGPLRPLKFEAPTPRAETMFLTSLSETRDRYRGYLAEARAGRLSLVNTDFDTGRRSAHGEYELADKTYAELLDRFAKHHFRGISPSLARNILAYYDKAPDRVSGRKEAKRLKEVRERLAMLREAMQTGGITQ